MTISCILSIAVQILFDISKLKLALMISLPSSKSMSLYEYSGFKLII